MLVFLRGKGLEPALPNVTAGAMTPQVATHVRGHQPVHPAAQFAVLAGPEGKVEVVGHEAVGQDAHRGADTGLGHHIEEGVIIVGLVENRGPCVSPVKDVVGITS